MVKQTKKKKRRPKKSDVPVQPIPEGIHKGDPVLYMLQRLGDGTILMVECEVTTQNKKHEKYLLDLFKDKAFRMTRRVKPPKWYQPHQVKFGVTNNIKERLDSIVEDPYESGVTEWRKLSNGEMAIAHNRFRWIRNRTKINLVGLVAIAALILWLYWITKMN